MTTKRRRGKPRPKVDPRATATALEPRAESRRGEWVWAAAVVLLAWAHRVAFLFSNKDRDWPFTVFYQGDAETFFLHARAILAGQPYDAGLPFHPPGFPYFLAGLHQLVGAGDASAAVPHLVVKILLALVASLGLGFLYLLVRPYLGHGVALLAAALCLYHFGLSVLAIATVSEGLYFTLLTGALLLWSRGLPHPLRPPGAAPTQGWRMLVAATGLGILLGLCALTRAEAILVGGLLGLVGLVGWLLRVRTGEADRRGLLPWALVLLGFVLTLTPWTLRNAESLAATNARLGPRLAEPLPTFVPTTLYGPLNLALANNPKADGSFSRDWMSSQTQSGQLDLTNRQHLEFLLHGDRMAWRWIQENPGDFQSLVGKKWILFAEAWKYGWTGWNWPAGLTGERRPVDAFVPRTSPVPWVLGPLTLAGVLLALLGGAARRRWLGIVLLLTFASLVTTALFFGYARLGLLLFPFTAPLAALALVRLGQLLGKLLPDRLRRPLRFAPYLLAAFLLGLALWSSGLDRTYRATGTTLPGSQRLNPDLPVTLEPM